MNEAAYWMALAHLPKWRRLKINNLIINFFHESNLSIEDFFNLSEHEWENKFSLSKKEISDLHKAKSELPNNAFLAESLLSQGFEIIPITSNDYSKTLKANLKTTYAPAVIYLKGNKEILNERSVAVVGSRVASEISLQFTDNIAKKASKEFKVIVSGFAKGVDKQAFDSAIKYKGQSIIVLPQGITTFGSGFKNYYKQITGGDVLVISTFFPNAPWSVELAMARNPVIYGLADEIYVAESGGKGGTWAGAIDGLRKERKIFVRIPEINENNANEVLIQKGAVAVDLNGNEISKIVQQEKSKEDLSVNELSVENIEKRILELINGTSLTANEIIKQLSINWTVKKLSTFLKKSDRFIIIKKGRVNFYTLKDEEKDSQGKLFS